MKFKKSQKLTTDILPPHNFFILALKPIGAKGYFVQLSGESSKLPYYGR